MPVMKFGATMWFTEYAISPSELAVALEERGFESLWASEHSHLPVVEGEELPKGKRCSVTLGLSALQDGWSGCQFHGISSSMRF
jgi:alkanesulfonate monooxygenase SsuD/methylene tetrahydromethanopterin reductase-like flavin-dependent oxidoreductase (luciferase family)